MTDQTTPETEPVETPAAAAPETVPVEETTPAETPAPAEAPAEAAPAEAPPLAKLPRHRSDVRGQIFDEHPDWRDVITRAARVEVPSMAILDHVRPQYDACQTVTEDECNKLVDGWWTEARAAVFGAEAVRAAA